MHILAYEVGAVIRQQIYDRTLTVINLYTTS